MIFRPVLSFSCRLSRGSELITFVQDAMRLVNRIGLNEDEVDVQKISSLELLTKAHDMTREMQKYVRLVFSKGVEVADK